MGIETFVGAYAYLIKPRPGASTLAWEVGCFPEKVPYIAVWDYEKGRTMTLGDSFGLAFWSSYAGRGSQNQYSLDILMNMILYSIKRDVPTEVLVFNRMRTSFVKFRTKMALLVSLMEFAQKFGANDQRMERIVAELEEEASLAKDHYLLGEFEECEAIMDSLFDEKFREAEAMMMVLKKRALMWVYLVEWSAVTATLMISSFFLWTIMVRRRLYRAVKVTRPKTR